MLFRSPGNVNTTDINSNDIDYNSILNQQNNSGKAFFEVELSETGESTVMSKEKDSNFNSQFLTENDSDDRTFQNDPTFSSTSSSSASQFDSLKPPKPPGFFSGAYLSSLIN